MRSPIKKSGLAILMLATGILCTGEQSRVFSQTPQNEYYQYAANYQGYGNQADTGQLVSGMGATHECSACNSCNCTVGEGLIPCYKKQYGGLYVDGWISAGGISDNQPLLKHQASGWNDADSGNFKMDQAYLILGREAQNCNGWGLGGRADLLFGTDYLYTSSLGLESYNTTARGIPAANIYAAEPHWNRNENGGYPEYGLALPQLYAEVTAPILDGLSVKLGHFYSPLGYESVMTPSNFFYSHTYSMMYGEAKTLTGILATQKMNKNWSLIYGMAQGWDAWESPTDELSWIGGAKWENDCKTSSLSFVAMTGKEQMTADYAGTLTNYSLVFQQNLTPALQFVLQHDYGFAQDGSAEVDATGKVVRADANWYTLASYLYYQVSDKLAIGGRFEWFKDKNHSRILSNQSAFLPYFHYTGDSFYNASVGLNWKPTNWITIRPEVRWDWTNTSLADQQGNVVLPGPYSQYTKDSVCTVGGDMIVRF